MNTTATGGGFRECELVQWSKLCEVSNEQTILGTTRGPGPSLAMVVGSSLAPYLHYDICEALAIDSCEGNAIASILLKKIG